MPRVSWPYEPASERKHGVCAVNRSGSVSVSTIVSRTKFVSETSAVGISRSLFSPSSANRSAANFGSWPVPNSVASLTRYGT